MKKAFIFVLLVFAWSICFGCDCADLEISKARLLNYSQNKNVFIGKIISSDSNSYLVRVEEVFKGDLIIGCVLKGVSSDCSLLPLFGENWIIYTNDINNGTIVINECSISRSLNNPMKINLYDIPCPINFNNKSDYEMELSLTRIRAIEDVNKEINYLRLLKRKNNQSNKTNDYHFFKPLQLLICILLLIIGLFVSFKFKKKKNKNK